MLGEYIHPNNSTISLEKEIVVRNSENMAIFRNIFECFLQFVDMLHFVFAEDLPCLVMLIIEMQTTRKTLQRQFRVSTLGLNFSLQSIIVLVLSCQEESTEHCPCN
jgi:hypothetical protein